MVDYGELTDAQKSLATCYMDPVAWIIHNDISLGHGLWQVTGRNYLLDVLRCDGKRQCVIKGSQLGFSENWILKTIWGLVHGRYKKGSLYLFPSAKNMEVFSKTRFTPLIDNNGCISVHITNTDSAYVKRFGNAFLYLRGARATETVGSGSTGKKDSAELRSISVDRIVYDECDLMDPKMVTLASKRLGDSEVCEEMFLSTPTIPDYGIDRLYKSSDQRVWMIKCRSCGKETCLELEFPECIKVRDDGSGFRSCIHCGCEIYSDDGRWVAQYPDADLVGWWLSRLNSPRADVAEIYRMFHDPPGGNLAEVCNSELGMAYIPAENRLSAGEVLDCCIAENAMKMEHDGPTCMGFDVGKTFHVVIAEKPSDRRLRVVKLARVSGENDVYDLGKRYNVAFAVCDKYPETRLARKMSENMSFPLFLCGYQDGKKKGVTDWSDVTKEIVGNRTELCDASHELIISAGLELPRVGDEVKEFAKQVCNMAKVLQEDEETGAKNYIYRKLGADHYRHALNYLMLASERTGTTSSLKVIANFWRRRRRPGRTAMTV